LEQIASDVRIHFTTLYSWLKWDGKRAGIAASESAELREARKQIRLLGQGKGAAPGCGVSVSGDPAGPFGECIYPLIRELTFIVTTRSSGNSFW
jgi:hypothetical protein